MPFLLFRKLGMKEQIKSTNARMIVTAEMGRVKKISKLPFEKRRD